MPRSPDGGYSLPSGTLVNTGDTVLPSQHNPAMQDIAQSMANSLSRDGLGGMRADLDMGGYSISNANSVFVGGNLVWHAGNFNPANYAALASSPTFTGGIVTARGSPGFGYVTLNTGAVSTSGYVAFFRPSGARVGYIGNLGGTSGAGIMEIINETGGDIYLNQRTRIFTEYVPRSVRGNQFGVNITDGTGTPTGGADGDLYFQYTP